MSDIDVTRPVSDYQFRNGQHREILFIAKGPVWLHVVHRNHLDGEVYNGKRFFDGVYREGKHHHLDVIPKEVQKYQRLIRSGDPQAYPYDTHHVVDSPPTIYPYITWIEGQRDETLDLIKGPDDE